MDNKPTSYANLKPVDGHKYYFRNPISRIIYYSRGRTKFSCRTEKIQEAIDFVQRKLMIQEGFSEGAVLRRMAGATNPFLIHLWCEFIEFRKEDRGEATIIKYQVNWKHGIEGFWGDKQAGDINDANLLQYRSWYLKNHPKRYFIHTKSHLHEFFKWLRVQRIISQVPSFQPLTRVEEIVIKNARRKAPDRRLEDHEVDTLLEVSAKSIYPIGLESGHLPPPKKLLLSHRAHLGILLGVRAGLRKMEACGLRWEHIDLREGLAQVWSTKNSKWRDVPLVAEVIAALKKQRLLVGESEWVFPMPSNPDKHISSQVFDHVWVRCKKTAGITRRTRFHDLRHTFASITADEGWPPVVACQVLDMSLRIYTKTYCKASTEKKQELMEKTFANRKGSKSGGKVLDLPQTKSER